MVARSRRPAPDRPGVLIIVQNLPVPFDRRVWLECAALTAAGYQVSVVCPAGPGDPPVEELDGVTIYKYRPPKTGLGKAAFVREYLHSFLATAWLTGRAWRRDRFQVLQACNPPDIFWPLALALRARGVKFVFDHHDLCPELYESKFNHRSGMLYRLLLVLERRTFRAAHHVISTNDSYRSIAMRRGGKAPSEVTVVRTGPSEERMQPGPASPERRRGRRYHVAYLGVMGVQDGVDLAVRAAGHIVHDLGRTDVSFTFVGSGESFDRLVELCHELDLVDYVALPGRLPDADVADVLSSADIGLCPDPKNPLNDVSTMNKTMEYMAFGLPVVAFDLCETRVSAGDAAVYVAGNDFRAFGQRVVDLLDDPLSRQRMAVRGRRRILESLAWVHQEQRYVGVYDLLTGRRETRTWAGAALEQRAS